jgi:hypothetical protein
MRRGNGGIVLSTARCLWLSTLINVIVPGDVARCFGPLQFQLVFVYDMLLDQIAAGLVNGVRYVGVQLVRYVFFFVFSAFSHSGAAVIAIIAANVILVTATWAAIRQLSAWHGDKWTVAAFDNFQIADHEAVVEGDGAEGPQPIFGLFHQLDSNFSNVHSY